MASLSPSSSLLSLSKHSPAFDEFAASIWGITLRMPNTLLFKHEHGINISSGLHFKASGRLARLRRIGLIYDFGHNNSSVGSVMQELKQFVVNCKDCRRDVSSGVKVFPFQSIVVTCPLCGKQSRYRPSEVLLGWPNQLAAKKQRGGGR